MISSTMNRPSTTGRVLKAASILFAIVLTGTAIDLRNIPGLHESCRAPLFEKMQITRPTPQWFAHHCRKSITSQTFIVVKDRDLCEALELDDS
jgi:hypothetical protein